MVTEARWIELRNEKWDGSLNRRATVEVLRTDPDGVWVWMPRGTPIERIGSSTAHPCDAVAFLSTDRHWQITWLYDFDTAVYVDIAMPAIVEGDRIRSVDLDLDVDRHIDGTVEILDRDEFDEHRVRFGYPDDVAERALAEARRVAADLAAGRAPFTASPDDGRLDDLIGPRRDAATPDDWVRAPNIAGDPATYELENEAIERDGRLDAALRDIAPWNSQTLLDIGCGTGFWLPRYANSAARVIGVEPDPQLVGFAQARVAGSSITVLPGSAEHLPLGDDSIDIAHARFAYFFGPGADAGLEEVARVLRPHGALLVVDNSWRGGEFADLLRACDVGNPHSIPTRPTVGGPIEARSATRWSVAGRRRRPTSSNGSCASSSRPRWSTGSSPVDRPRPSSTIDSPCTCGARERVPAQSCDELDRDRRRIPESESTFDFVTSSASAATAASASVSSSSPASVSTSS